MNEKIVRLIKDLNIFLKHDSFCNAKLGVNCTCGLDNLLFELEMETEKQEAQSWKNFIYE